MKNQFNIALLALAVAAGAGCKKEAANPGSPPVLTTAYVNVQTKTIAVGQSMVTDEGSAAVTARGICWATHTAPTIADHKSVDGTGAGMFLSTLTGLTDQTLYSARSYATNSYGTSYGNEVNFFVLIIGESYGGGRVAYILQPGDKGYKNTETHGLIAAINDLTVYTMRWKDQFAPDVITGATGTAIGTGHTNTITIVSQMGAGDYAAKKCTELVQGGYDDWYLPSRDELYQLYLNKSLLGGFTADFYWSSTEADKEHAVLQHFNDSGRNNDYKVDDQKVRPVRSF